MLFDWFTLIAQLINFLILVWLLYRFLYKPITKTIQTRQNQLEKRWREADKKQAAANAEMASYQQKQQELAQKEQEFLDRAQEQGEQKYHQLVRQARQEVAQKQATWENAIAQQQEQFLETLKEKVTQQVYAITRQALRELADVNLEEQAIANFLDRLKNLNQSERNNLARSLQHSDNGLVIRSGFELSQQTRNQIVDSLQQQQLYQGNNVQFTTTPGLICGLELQASDYKVAWNLQSYLQSLDEHLAPDFPQNGRDEN
ncbi:MAG TPA: F0F1 ATP synthase subunit B [Xenococcaceae cyanobacterium]